MRVELLGAFAARIAGTGVAPTASKPCQVLAVLAMNSGRTVATTTLFQEIWGGLPPASASTTLQTYIHQLRRRMDAAAGGTGVRARDLLSTERNGYLLSAEISTDVQEFAECSRRGKAAFEAGDHRTASQLLASALGLWRGPFLTDLPVGPVLTVNGLALEDRHFGVLHRRIEADLLLGRHHELVGELRTLTLAHPINENLAGHYMVCLHRTGQLAAALAEYRRIRTALIRELGVEPSPYLQELHAGILSRDLDRSARTG